MKISARQADSFSRKPNPTARAILVYGPDRGLVRERLDQLTLTVVDDKADPFRVAELSGAQIAADPALLSDEVSAFAMSGGRRVVRVREAGDTATDVLRRLLDDDAGEALVLVEAGELGGRSSLRKLFESAAAAAAVACYADEGAALEQLIGQVLTSYDVAVAADVRALIAGLIGGDRALARRELEKLALYIGPGGEATAEHVMAVVGDTTELSLQEVAFAAADGDQVALARALDKVWQEGMSPVAIMRACGNHLLRLHRVAGAISGGTPADAAMAALRPTVFWKSQPRFRRQVGRWRPERLAAALWWLTDAEADAKSTGRPDRVICDRTLTRIAAVASKGAVAR